MITGTVWGITLIVIGVIATFAATQLLLTAIFRARADAARRRLRTGPVSATLIGVVSFWVPVLIAIGAGQAAPAAGALLGLVIGQIALFGLGVVASEIGDRLPSTGAAATPWRSQLRGSIALSLASLLPAAGWVIVFPLAVHAGFGALIASFAGAKAPAAAPLRESAELQLAPAPAPEPQLTEASA